MPLTLEQTITYLKSRCYKYDRGTCALPRCKENRGQIPGAEPTCEYSMAVHYLQQINAKPVTNEDHSDC